MIVSGTSLSSCQKFLEEMWEDITGSAEVTKSEIIPLDNIDLFKKKQKTVALEILKTF